MSDNARFLSAKVSSSLGDQLKLHSFSGSEGVSTLFRFDLTFTTDKPIPRTKLESQLLGHDVTVELQTPDGVRRFSGSISDLATQAVHDGRVEIHATMVPFLWFLEKKSDCRVFQDQTTVDIVQKVIDGAGRVIDKTGGKNVTRWPYCVQFRETDLNFVSRLLEQDGIFYYFEHGDDGHKLVLGNDNSHFAEPSGKSIDLRKGDFRGESYSDALDNWQMRLMTVSGKWSHGDYNFQDAKTKLVSNEVIEQPVKRVKACEVYDYPGEFAKKADGDFLARVRSDEIGHEQRRYFAESGARQIESGRAFLVGSHPDPDASGKPFVVVSATHMASTNDDKLSGEGTTNTYRNHFNAIPYDRGFHPPRVTPKPSVNGVQSAIVVGPPGEEIYTDEYGRVKVRFHWDRSENDHDKRSCFIRVAQMMAGREWGFMAIPRIGQEVIVEFLDGDPDCPLIVGSVYNSDQMPAYNPKQMASRIYLKSNSTKGGRGFNEIMLDDRKDSERLFLHAQKDLDVRVRNDERKWVCGNAHQVIGWEEDGDKGKGGDRYFHVMQDNQSHVGRNHDEHVEGNYNLLVGAGEADDGGTLNAIIDKKVAISIGKDGLQSSIEGDAIYQVDGSLSTTVDKDMMHKVGGGFHQTVTGDHNAKAANLSIDLDQQGNIKAGMKLALDAGTEVHIKSGTSLVIESGAAVTLKVGGNFININPGGIFIQGTLVGINSGGAAAPGTGCVVKPPKPPAPVSGKPNKATPKKPDQAHEEKTGKVSN